MGISTKIKRGEFLAIVGLGKEIWKDESGDEFVERMRSEPACDAVTPLSPNRPPQSSDSHDLTGDVWDG